MKNLVHCIALLYYISYFVGEIGLTIFIVHYHLPFYYWLLYTVAIFIGFVIIAGLDYTVKKVTDLEEILLNKNIISEANIEKLTEPNIKGIEFCKKCNYQLFPEDKIPNCGMKRKEIHKDVKIL